MSTNAHDHFARPVGGFTTATQPFTCAVCGRPVEQRPNNWRVWRHAASGSRTMQQRHPIDREAARRGFTE